MGSPSSSRWSLSLARLRKTKVTYMVSALLPSEVDDTTEMSLITFLCFCPLYLYVNVMRGIAKLLFAIQSSKALHRNAI